MENNQINFDNYLMNNVDKNEKDLELVNENIDQETLNNRIDLESKIININLKLENDKIDQESVNNHIENIANNDYIDLELESDNSDREFEIDQTDLELENDSIDPKEDIENNDLEPANDHLDQEPADDNLELEPVNDSIDLESINNSKYLSEDNAQDIDRITNDVSNINKVEKTINLKLLRFPVSRVKFLMKCDPDVTVTNTDAVILIGKAAELFISHITSKIYTHSQQIKRKSIQKNDFDYAINNFDEFSFLEGIFEN